MSPQAMEQPVPSIRRLLNRRTVTSLLQGFAQLLPEVAFALLDRDGQVYLEAGTAGAGEDAPTPISLPLQVGELPVGTLVACGPGLRQPRVQEAMLLLRYSLQEMIERAQENRALAQETLERYREINLLYNIGETIAASLDPEEIPRLMLAEAARVISADCGLVLLRDEGGHVSPRARFGPADELERAGRMLIQETLADPKPRIYTMPPAGNGAMEAMLCAPLKTRERVLGLVLLGRLAGRPVFKAADEKLLLALASQAAVAVENAYLFADVRRQRDEIAEMKNRMDNIFASIASGVITTDVGDLVTILNRAAERILGVRADEAIGWPYTQALREVGPQIAPLVETVKRQGRQVIGHEVQPVLPQRGPVALQFHLSPVKDNRDQTIGIAIVVDDLTERRQLEEQVRKVRTTFERYVAPQVVEQLLSDPSSVQLGGVRQEVTVLFADIRGFTAFGEKLSPETLVQVLNQHLTLAAEAIFAEKGTLDKFIGDAVVAIYNAPLPQPDHAVRAVRSALAMQRQIAALHADLPPQERLNFGIGIATGIAVVGNIGSPQLQNYTVVGDCINLASRLQTHAGPGQILLNRQAYEQTRSLVMAREVGYVQVRGRSEADLVYEVLGLRES